MYACVYASVCIGIYLCIGVCVYVVYVCAQVYVCICAILLCAQVYICVHGGKHLCQMSASVALYAIFEAASLTDPCIMAFYLDWLASSLHLSLPSQCRGSNCAPPHLGFICVVGILSLRSSLSHLPSCVSSSAAIRLLFSGHVDTLASDDS